MVSKTKQLSYWQGKFGDDYISRNSDWDFFAKRKPFFKKLMKKYSDIQTALEVGCNVGRNLEIIKSVKSDIKLFGLEPNKKAAKIARNNLAGETILEKSIFEIRWKNKFDLVFTAGVLIHIGNDDITCAMSKIYHASKKYILAIEYYWPERKIIPYRGLGDALFKRPYDKEYLDLFPRLKIVSKGSLNMSQGFDNCKFWLFEK